MDNPGHKETTMVRHEFEITHATIRYAMQCMQESNWHALREMGFGPRECEAVAGLTLADLSALAQRVHGHVLKVQLEPALFWQALKHIKQESTQQHTVTDLIQRDAPADMMHVLFGMGEKTYTRMRHQLHVSIGVGRPAELHRDTIMALSAILDRFDMPLSPADWLEVADETGLSLRDMWREYRRWHMPSHSSDSDGESDRNRP